MRILGFITLCLQVIANLTMKTRLPPKRLAGGMFNFKAFKTPAFSTYCCTAFTAFLGLYTRTLGYTFFNLDIFHS